MKKTNPILVHLILGILSIAGIIGITAEAASLYTLVSTHQEETESATAKGKRISSDLYGNLEFYAVLEDDETWSEVTRDEFEQLDDGDTIEIAKKDSSDNKAYRSEIYKSILFIVLYAIGPSHYICFLIARTRRVKGWGWLGWPSGVTLQLLLYGFLAAILIYGYSSIGKMVFNAVQSYTGTQHETEAIVTASDADINSGRHETNYYHLALQYEDADGNTIHMTKEVRPSVYKNSTKSAEISFPEDDPYRVHTKGFSLSDIFFYSTKLVPEVITILLTLILSLIPRYIFSNFSYGSWKRRRKKKKQSKEQSKRDRRKHKLIMKNKKRYEKSQKKKPKRKNARSS
ncbi:hypothetical protein [Terribacillus saccharophilus]|uniref:hypothetical protein n=1 Tax=Terribacillus saccharophilus TaxID=361277 RepID=UPI002989D3F6|nr:hypothetical protein [Terribacillus saccharophilus]MCM3225692.1 hypothetical protein [Terribacillus saccharophilus]